MTVKKFLKLIPAILLTLCIFIIPLETRADFGDFAGDSDYDYDSGWDSGWHDDDDWDSDDDYDSGGNYYSGGSSHHSSGGDTDLSEIVFVGMIIIWIVLYTTRAAKRSGKNAGRRVNSRPVNRLNSIYQYLNIDPNFSTYDFQQKVSNLYVRFQKEWQNKNIEPLRPYMTGAMFGQMNSQLDNYRRNNQTNHIERISVLDTDILGWKQENGYDIIIVKLNTRIVDYVTDDYTGQVIRGSATKEKFMTYEWTLVRTTGVTTARSTGTTSQICPYCGAHVDINQNSVCEYCGSVLTTDTFDWAVSNIKGISQHTK